MSKPSGFKINRFYRALPSEDDDDQESASSSPSEKSHRKETTRDILTRILVTSSTLLTILLLVLLIFLYLHSSTSKGTQHNDTGQCQTYDATAIFSSDTPSVVTPQPYPDIHSPPIRSELLVPSPWNYQQPIDSPCGHTTASARAANCQWSAMTFGWYPSACFDAALEADFLQLKNWTWHSDESLSENSILPRDDVLRGNVRRAWVSVEFHMQHCDFSTRKLLRAFLGVVLSDNYVVRMGHLLHCENFRERAKGGGEDGEKGRVTAAMGVAKYFDCVII